MGLVTKPTYAQDDDPFPRNVTDATGATITIPAQPEMIAVIRDYPPVRVLFDEDEIRALDPAQEPEWDGVGLLVVPQAQADAYSEVIESAQAAEIPVYQTPTVPTLETWRDVVDQLGYATGREDRAAEVLDQLDLRQLTVTVAVRDERAPRVLVLTPEGYTFGQGAFFTGLIEAAGGVNVAAETGFAEFRQIDDPTIRNLTPEVILLTPAWTDEQIDAFITDPQNALIPAVYAGRVLRLPFAPTFPDDPATVLVALSVMLHPLPVLGH
jgi:ABC-type Fe3+-hydroxamate transport system substrate-binding protein